MSGGVAVRGFDRSVAEFNRSFWSEIETGVDRTTAARERLLAACLWRFLNPSGKRPVENRLSENQSSGERFSGNRLPKVLDAGCGLGEFTAFLRGKGYDAVGVDIAANALERARALSPSSLFIQGSLEATLPLASATFDAVWSSEVLEHLFDVQAALAELNRVLRPGGLLLITTPYHGRVKNMAVALAAFEHHFDPESGHIRFFTKSSLTSCLRRAGFLPIMWRGVGRCWPIHKSFFVAARKVGRPISADVSVTAA